jgi:hypothetical protein
MNSISTKFALAIALALSVSASPAMAQKLVPYYQIGGDKTEWVRWDTYVVDASSLRMEGTLLKYRTMRIAVAGSDPPQEMLADCKAKTRGQPPDPVMRSTYDGTLGGEEVKIACALALKVGLLGK